MKNRRRLDRTGVSHLYVLVLMPALIGLSSLGVDWGRVQLVKTELQRATDAAARAGAACLPGDPAGAVAAARELAAANLADGSAVGLAPADVQVGRWDAAARTFTALTAFDFAYATGSPNAVRVTAARTAARGNAPGLSFGRIIGRASCDTAATSIAVVSGGASTTVTVPGTGDPYLAGMPAGSRASSVDAAPGQSPTAVTGVDIKPGAELTFTFTGGVRNNPTFNDYAPDGNLGWVLAHDAGAENGIANVRMPINALLGVFLSDARPDATAAPSMLDFGAPPSREFKALRPALKQPFFIGNGSNGAGDVQRFVVPAGATRFYLGTMDGFEWKNNLGSFTTTVANPKVISLVK